MGLKVDTFSCVWNKIRGFGNGAKYQRLKKKNFEDQTLSVVPIGFELNTTTLRFWHIHILWSRKWNNSLSRYWRESKGGGRNQKPLIFIHPWTLYNDLIIGNLLLRVWWGSNVGLWEFHWYIRQEIIKGFGDWGKNSRGEKEKKRKFGENKTFDSTKS